MRFPIENRAGIEPQAFARLAETVAGHASIKHAIDWLQGLRPPRAPADMVTQDEFSHDILIPYLDELWLVYDVT